MPGIGLLDARITTPREPKDAFAPGLFVGVITRNHIQVVGVKPDDKKIPVSFRKAALKDSLETWDTPTSPVIVILRGKITNLQHDGDRRDLIGILQ